MADPTATILSVALLLDHLGLAEAGAAVEAAVVADLAERGRLPSQHPRGRRRRAGPVVTSLRRTGCRVQGRMVTLGS